MENSMERKDMSGTDLFALDAELSGCSGNDLVNHGLGIAQVSPPIRQIGTESFASDLSSRRSLDVDTDGFPQALPGGGCFAQVSDGGSRSCLKGNTLLST